MIKFFKRIKWLKNCVSNQFSEFHLEMDKNQKGISMLVGGTFSIKEYGDNSCILKTEIGSINISGKGLSISVYENKTVEISGNVEELSIAYSKN